jgi:O-antigen ligase
MSSTNAPFGIRLDIAIVQRGQAAFTSLLLCTTIGLSYFLSQGHDDQRLLQLACLGVLSITLLLRGGGSMRAFAPGQGIVSACLIAFFSLGALSSLFALSPRHALLEVALLLLLLLLAFCVAREIAQDSGRCLPLILNVCAIFAALYALQVLAMYASALVLGSQPAIDAFAPGFSNYRFLNHAQTISLPLLALLCLLIDPAQQRKWAYYALTAFCWTLLFLTSGRGTFVGLVAGTAAALVLRGRHAAAFCKTMLLTALAGLAIYAVFFALIPMALGLEPFGLISRVAQRTVEDPTSLRLPLWSRAIELIVAHPWLGAGPLHFAHSALDGLLPAHPHDWILQIAAEWGLPALLCMVVAIGLSWRRLVRTAAHIPAGDRYNQNILAAWIATGLAILVDGLVSGSLVMPVSQLWIALYVGCAAGWARSCAAPGRTHRPSSLRRGVAGVVLLLAVAAVVIGIAPDVGHRGSLGTAPAKPPSWFDGVHHPRFWLDGYF